MNLPRGFGVVVDYVVPKSPAAEAGLQRSDIIRMLNDQIIVGSGQLGVLVRSFPEGTTVTLTILRKGQEMKIPVKLSKKETPANRDYDVGSNDWDFDWDFDDDGKMSFNFQAPDMSAVRDAVHAAVEQARDQARRAGDEARRAGEEARKAAQRLRIVTTDSGTTRSTKVDLGNATITFSDNNGELKVESHDGKKTLTARDPQGKILFQGPIDSNEDRAKIPPQVRERFEKLENQELPEIPEAPEPPEPPDNTQSVQLNNSACIKPAALTPQHRTGWQRNTILL
jgi:hypothetical protein